MAHTRRLRTRRDRRREAALAELRDKAQELEEVLPDLAPRVATMAERKLQSERGWRFIMVEPNLYAGVVRHLRAHSSRPLVALQLWAELFALMPDDSNEVQATRQELADLVGCSPDEISIVMKELESLNAVHRVRDGRGVRYFVDARFGTHLAGAARDQAQAVADRQRPLKLVQPA
jgi:CRP-like cAMP-binding protein